MAVISQPNSYPKTISLDLALAASITHKPRYLRSYRESKSPVTTTEQAHKKKILIRCASEMACADVVVYHSVPRASFAAAYEVMFSAKCDDFQNSIDASSVTIRRCDKSLFERS